MEITILLFFLGLAILAFFSGKFFKELREAGPFLSGFVLILVAVLVMTTGIQYKTGENCLETSDTVGVCLVSVNTYSDVGDIERVSTSGLILAIGLILFLTGHFERKARIEQNL